MAFNLPTVKLEASFIDNPTSGSPTWTDITSAFQSATTARGRQVGMPSGTAFDVGQATFILDNTNGDFDPTYTGGSYYPHVIPLVPLRLSATWNSITYRVFTGFASGWPSTYDIGNTYEYVTVTAVDALGLLSDDNYTNASDTGESTDSRISRILTGVGLGSLPQNFDTGETHVATMTQVNNNALSYCQSVELSEYGAFFVARDGTLTFQNRNHRNGASSSATFGDGGGSEIPYNDLQPTDDKTLLVNYCQVTDTQAKPHTYTYSDSASITKYTLRSANGGSPIQNLTDTPNEGYDQATWIVISQKDHSWRVPLMQFASQRGGSSGGGNTMWPQALGREISDLITVKRRPPSGNVINEQVFIERIEHDISPGNWQTRFGLSPKLLSQTNSFTLNDATLGKLNSGGVLAY